MSSTLWRVALARIWIGRRPPVDVDPVIEIRPGKKRYRQYVRYDVTRQRHETTTGHTYTFPLRWDIAADDESKFNVAENVRANPPRGPKYKAHYGWRQTIENDNAQSDARKYLRRGRSNAVAWNLFDEIAWAIMVNGVALQQHRERLAATGGASPPVVLAA